MQIRYIKLYLALLVAAICLETTANMISNSSFQTGRDGWNFFDKGMSSVVKIDDSNGKFALQINDENSQAGSSVRSHKIKIKPRQYYKLTFYAKVNAPDAWNNVGGVYFVFSKDKKIFNKLKEKSQVKLKDTKCKWQRYEAVVKAPDDAANLQIWIHSYNGNTSRILLNRIELQAVKGKIEKELSLKGDSMITGLDLESLPDHPRLFWRGKDTVRIKEAINNNSFLNEINRQIFSYAEDYLKAPRLIRKVSGRRMLFTSQKAFYMISILAYAYRLSGDKQYADRAIQVMETAAGFKDWNPRHFLDCAEMTAALAIGYDWLYDQLSEKQKDLISNAIVKMGLINAWSQDWFWRKAKSNWAQVCYGGLTLGALSIAEKYPEIARKTIAESFAGIKNPLSYYEPDGAYPEGPGYWIYGTSYNVLYFAALESCGASIKYPQGFLKSSEFFLNSIGPAGAFNYSDSSARKYVAEITFWFAGKGADLNLSEQKNCFSSVAKKKLFSRFITFLPIWASKLKKEKNVEQKKQSIVWTANGPGTVGFIKAVNKQDTLFAGIKLGSPRLSHGHMDAGTFVFDALKKRWAIDLGTVNYHHYETNKVGMWDRSQNSDRWKIMAYSQNGHNVFNIDGKQQDVNSHCKIIKSVEKDNYYAIAADITSAYKGQLKAAERTIAIVDNKYFSVEDHIKNINKKQRFQWGVNVPKDIQFNGREAIVTKDGKKVKYVVVSPENLKWETIPRVYHWEFDKKYSNRHFSGSVRIGFNYELKPNEEQALKVSIIPEK